MPATFYCWTSEFSHVCSNWASLKLQRGTTDIQSCPIKLPPLFRAPAVWVVPGAILIELTIFIGHVLGKSTGTTQ